MIVGLRRGQARRRPDLQRVAGRPRAARPQEGRQGRREGPGRRLRLHDHRDQLAASGPAPVSAVAAERRHGEQGRKGAAAWTGRTNWPRASTGRRSSTTPRRPSGTVHVGSLRGPVILDVITRALRARGLRDHAALRRGRPGPDGRPGAAHARRHRARDGPPAGPRPGSQAGDCHASYARHFARHLHRHLRRPRHPPGPLLLDERHLPHGADGPVHPDGPRPRRRGARHLPPRGQRPAPRPLAAARRRSAPTAARWARPSRPTGTARRCPSPAGRTS